MSLCEDGAAFLGEFDGIHEHEVAVQQLLTGISDGKHVLFLESALHHNLLHREAGQQVPGDPETHGGKIQLPVLLQQVTLAYFENPFSLTTTPMLLKKHLTSIQKPKCVR